MTNESKKSKGKLENIETKKKEQYTKTYGMQQKQQSQNFMIF